MCYKAIFCIWLVRTKEFLVCGGLPNLELKSRSASAIRINKQLLLVSDYSMVKLTEDMVVARTRVSDMNHVKKLNCWGAELSDISVLRKLKHVEVLSLR